MTGEGRVCIIRLERRKKVDVVAGRVDMLPVRGISQS